MRTTLKHLIVGLTLVLAGGMALSAQHGGRDRLPRILDPLGILPTPRQVLRTLDQVARVLPPVVIEGGRYDACDPAYGYGYDYDDVRRPVHFRYGPPPVRRIHREAGPWAAPSYGREFRHGGYAYRHDGHDGHGGRGRR